MLTIAEKGLRNCRQKFLMFLLSLVCVPTISGASEKLDYEIKPFSLIGTTAALKVGFLSDRRRQSNFATSNSESTVWQEELLVGTQSYVYHPGFLNIKLDLLPRLVQQRVSTGDESDSLSESLLGFDTQFNFLSLKTYPFSVFARRTYPSSFVGPVASYRIENDEHGITGIVAGPGQTTLRYGITRQSIDGEGFDSIIDESRDRGTLRLEIPYSKLGFVGVTYEAIDQDSSSGSPGLPIQRSLLSQDNFTIDARHNYGERGQNYLNQGLGLLKYTLEAGQLSIVDDLRYNITNRHEISDAMATNIGYTYSSSERLDSESKLQSAVTGFTHSLQSGLRYSATAALEDSRATGQDRRVARVGGDIRHSLTTTRLGTIGLAGSVYQRRTDQESTADTVPVFDEALVLEGTTPVELRNELVVAASVIITNESRTQTFIEGFDYQLIIIGNITSVQRLVQGNILDGQTVIVDYEYRTTGTAKFSTFGSAVSASINILSFAQASIRYSMTDTNVNEGELTSPVNDRREFEFRIDADHQAGNHWTVGGGYRYLRNDEDIAPSVLNDFRLRASASVFGSAQLKMSAGVTRVDQKTSVEDIDQVFATLGMSGRLWRRLQLSYDAIYIDDSGGSSPRERFQHRLNADWRYRSLIFQMRAYLTQEAQDVSDRLDHRIRIDVTRLF